MGDITESVSFSTKKSSDIEKMAAFIEESQPSSPEEATMMDSLADNDIYNKLNAKKEEYILKTAGYKPSQLGPQYPSSLLSLSDLELPERTIDMFKWCKYFYTFDPLISGAINALAQFPITQLVLEESDHFLKSKSGAQDNAEGEFEQIESDEMKAVKYSLFQKINIYKLLIEIGIDYFLYGNCFVYGETTTGEDDEKQWAYVYRIPPDRIYIDVDFENKPSYRWNIPERIKKVVKNKKPAEQYLKIHPKIKEAVEKNKVVIIKPSNIFHFARPSDSMGESIWGMPVVANVMKLIMYRNVLRQAQEAVAREHIVPLRIFYLNPVSGANPNYGSGSTSPTEGLATEIRKWVGDPNYKIVSSAPVGMITAGGHGRSLLLGPEIEAVQSEILAGMNVPREFIFGGLSYSGSSISLRILENHFITYRLLLEDFINNFLVKNLMKARGIWHSEKDNDKLVHAKLSDLKMQDDAQQKQLMIGLNSSGKLSDEYLYYALGLDPYKVKNSMKKEAAELASNKKKMQIQQVRDMSDIQMAQIIENYRMQEFQAKINILFNSGKIEAISDLTLDKIEDLLKDINVSPEEISAMAPPPAEGEAAADPAMAGQPPQEGEMVPPSQPSIEGASPAAAEAPGQPQASSVDMQNLAMQILRENPNTRELMVSNLAGKGQAFASKVVQTMVQIAGGVMDDSDIQELKAMLESSGYQSEAGYLESDGEPEEKDVDMRPYPEQRPPRRNTLG